MSDKAMWSRAHATPGLKIEAGVLKKGMEGGLKAMRALTALVIPHGVTRIDDGAPIAPGSSE